MAVGWYLHRYASSWIAGRGWRPVAFGARTDPDAYLKSVSCVSRTFCLAVGRKNEHRHWIERWDGHRWRAVPTPDGRWFAVSCTSRTFCMMVGEYGGSAFWDGASVHAVPTPGQFTGAVSCVSSTDCTAVGATGFAAHGLITRWNGTSWVIEPSVRRVVNTRLLGVSCTAAGCTAVGSAGAGADLPFIERGT
jgi:hypothetical protein